MEIYNKLHKVKSEIGKVSKDSNNPFFKSRYFDINGLLENVEPLLQKNGLLLLQPIENNKVITKIIDIDKGDLVQSEIELPNLTDPQKLGSAITYYRRYTLQSLLGVQAEDDDANKASGNNAAKPKENEDTRKWLSEEGFKYLMDKGTLEDINTAFKDRKIKKDYRSKLEERKKSI